MDPGTKLRFAQDDGAFPIKIIQPQKLALSAPVPA